MCMSCKSHGMLRHADLMAMWQADLARLLHDAPAGKLGSAEMYNLQLIGRVWKQRFGHYPTVGEIYGILGQ